MKNIYEDPNEKYEKDDSVFVDLHPGRKNLGKIIWIIVAVGLVSGIVFALIKSINEIKEDFSFADYLDEYIPASEEELSLSFFEEFDASIVPSIFFGLDYANIEIIESDTDTIRVEAYGDDDLNEKFNVYYDNVENKEGMLNIVDTEYLLGGHNMFHQKPTISVLVPSDFAGDFLISLNSGDVFIGDFENAKVSANVESGNVWVESAKVISSEISYGNLENEKVDTIGAKVELGNITLGDVTSYCELKAECGDIEIEKLDLGFSSNIKIDFGNLDIRKTNDVKIDCEVPLGTCQINSSNPASPITLTVKVDCGNVNIN